MLEIKPDLAATLFDDSKFIPWLLRRIQVSVIRAPSLWFTSYSCQDDSFDSNKLYCTELLATIATHSDDVKLRLVAFNGIEILLQVLAVSASMRCVTQYLI